MILCDFWSYSVTLKGSLCLRCSHMIAFLNSQLIMIGLFIKSNVRSLLRRLRGENNRNGLYVTIEKQRVFNRFSISVRTLLDKGTFDYNWMCLCWYEISFRDTFRFADLNVSFCANITFRFADYTLQKKHKKRQKTTIKYNKTYWRTQFRSHNKLLINISCILSNQK